MTLLRDKTVLITGGAGGIGKLLAERCVVEGAGRVVLWDIDAEALERAAATLRAAGGTPVTAVVDLSNVGQIEAGARGLVANHGPVDILFNNAGIVVGKSFADHSCGDIESTIRINVLGVMHAARAFLPAMIEARRGHIVNIASAAGLTPNPNMSVYAASKWAVLGWSESLRLELAGVSHDLRVTTVCPSYIDTGMFHGARAPLLTPMLRPETAADRIIAAVKSNKVLLRAPRIVNLIPVLRGVLPTRVFDLLIGRGFRIYDSMDHFVGRSAEP